MKKTFLLLIIACVLSTSIAQTIKLSNGISYATAAREHWLKNKGVSYINSLGVDYCFKKYFYLSSELGFYSFQYKDKITFTSEQGYPLAYIKKHNLYGFDITQTFGFKIDFTPKKEKPTQYIQLYFGAGVNLKFLLRYEISTKYPKQYQLPEYYQGLNHTENMFMLSPCIRLETGFNYYITNKLMLGFNFNSDISLFLNRIHPSHFLFNQFVPLEFKFVIGYKINRRQPTKSN